MDSQSHTNTTKFRILVAPLDWGLGHATRCIAIIKTLIDKGVVPVVGAYGNGLVILKKEFPDLEVFEMPGFSLSYPGKFGLRLKVVASLPAMFYSIYKENRLLEQIIRDKKIDGIISDSRFGLYSDDVPCIYMSHQMLVRLPNLLGFLEYPFYLVTSLFTEKYSGRWIPDLPGYENLSGDLGHKYFNVNWKFIGTLKRFENKLADSTEIKYDLMVIISGLEKQRTVFEHMILAQVKELHDLKVIVVLGKPSENIRYELNRNSVVHSHLSAEEMYKCVVTSRTIVCRSGYSTLMELASLGKKAILIPTPGQTEQEYLAEYMQVKGYAPFYSQSEFVLKEALNEVDKYTGIPRLNGSELLADAVERFLDLVRETNTEESR